MSALIVDIILWGSVAVLGFIAWQRGRVVLVTSAARRHAWTSSISCRASRSA